MAKCPRVDSRMERPGLRSRLRESGRDLALVLKGAPLTAGPQPHTAPSLSSPWLPAGPVGQSSRDGLQDLPRDQEARKAEGLRRGRSPAWRAHS